MPALRSRARVWRARTTGSVRLMADADDTKECGRCSGSGKYADPQKGPLVQVTCPSCDGSGKVPADAPDEEPANEPTQIPFGSQPE